MAMRVYCSWPCWMQQQAKTLDVSEFVWEKITFKMGVQHEHHVFVTDCIVRDALNVQSGNERWWEDHQTLTFSVTGVFVGYFSGFMKVSDDLKI